MKDLLSIIQKRSYFQRLSNLLVYHHFKLFGFRSVSNIHRERLQNFDVNAEATNGSRRHLAHEIHLLDLNIIIENKDKIDVIVKDIEKARADGRNLPKFLTITDIQDLLELDSQRKRFKCLNFLFKKELIKQSEANKKEKRKEDRRNKVLLSSEQSSNNHIEYGSGKNTLLLRIQRRSKCKFYSTRLANAALFGQKIVIDLGYDEYMWKKERRDCAAQLRLVYSVNRMSRNPYDLYFCNAKPSTRCVQYLHEQIPNIDNSLISLTEQNYLDIFPKESLIYLSPHASETMTSYDHRAVYIIGAFVDTVKREPLSLDKAEKEGIKAYKLPIEEYILWGLGSKSLSINQAFEIMLEMKNSGDWKKAFKHVPSRKLRKIEANDTELQQLLADKMYLINK